MRDGRPGGQGVDGRRARHRRRLREPRPLPPLARLPAEPLRRPATTSSTTIAIPTTRTATARTSPGRSPRRPTTAIGADRARLRRETSCPCGCSTARRGRQRRDRPGHPLRRPPRRAGHQPLVRVRLGRRRRRDDRRTCSTRCATPARRRARRRRRRATRAAARSPIPRGRRRCSPSAPRPSTAALAEYSNAGASLDLVAPGGGAGRGPARRPACAPGSAAGAQRRADDLQHGSAPLVRAPRRRYTGTSMAAPHVAATAALVIASGVLGANPSPDAIDAPPQGDGARPRRPGSTATTAPGWSTRAAAAALRRGGAAAPSVVRMISTEQGAWWRDLVGHRAEQEALRARSCPCCRPR